MSPARFADEARALLRTRLLDATAELTVRDGWAGVTMAAVAQRVGVSRQTVYNELGGKPALGQALVLRELDDVMALVAAELARGDDLVDAVHRAVEAVARSSADNPLLKDVLTSAHGGGSSLLPWLTTDSAALLARAGSSLGQALAPRLEPLALGVAEADRLVEVVVRLVLSHVVQPSVAPDVVADRVAWVVERLVPPRPGGAG